MGTWNRLILPVNLWNSPSPATSLLWDPASQHNDERLMRCDRAILDDIYWEDAAGQGGASIYRGIRRFSCSHTVT